MNANGQFVKKCTVVSGYSHKLITPITLSNRDSLLYKIGTF